MNNSVLELAARQTTEANMPNNMPAVNSLYEQTIAELARIDRSVPEIGQASRQMAQLVAEQQLELAKLLDRDELKG